ncbi:hypothetical protein IT397_02515 [Candidatus Nomurabacteria bacterium]|nr:hypothetical protein [Candidatus Nomurabacteria bacterium]
MRKQVKVGHPKKPLTPEQKRVVDIIKGTDWKDFWEKVMEGARHDLDLYERARRRSLQGPPRWYDSASPVRRAKELLLIEPEIAIRIAKFGRMRRA